MLLFAFKWIYGKINSTFLKLILVKDELNLN